MGRWFASFLLKEGCEVVITGRNERKLLEARQRLDVAAISNNVEAVRNADAILIAVSIDNFERVVEQLHPYIQPKQVVVDITSTKVVPVEVMHKYIKTGLVLGMHPVFGPGADGVRKQNFVLTPTDEKESALARKIREHLETRGARVTLMTPHEHDEMMAVILGLTHFIAIVSADTLLSFDKLKQMGAAGGNSYKVLLTLVESVISEDPEFYASLQMDLPKMAEIEEMFQGRVKTWADLVKNKDRQKFAQQMSVLRKRIEKSDPNFGGAYEKMYKLMEEL